LGRQFAETLSPRLGIELPAGASTIALVINATVALRRLSPRIRSDRVNAIFQGIGMIRQALRDVCSLGER